MLGRSQEFLYMKNLLKLSPAVFLALVASAAPAKDAVPADPGYDKTAVAEINGTVTDVREVTKDKALAGLHLTVQTGSDSLDVYVGPVEFVKVCEFTFAKGDRVQVIGSKVTFEGAKVVLAREVTREKVTLLIRDKEGEPLWKYFIKPPVG